MVDNESGIGNDGIQGNLGESEDQKKGDPRKDTEAASEIARKIIEMGNAALSGEYDADYSLRGREKSQGREMQGQADEEDFVLWHENPAVQKVIMDWIVERLSVATSEDLEEAPKLALDTDQDDTMKMEVFAKEFGFEEHPWYIVRYLQKIEGGQFVNPLYMVRSGQQIQEQVEAFQELQRDGESGNS